MLTEVQEATGQKWTPDVQKLLARAMFPDPERVRLQLEAYRTDPSRRVFVWEEEGKAVCAAGVRQKEDEAEVLHVGTAPGHEGRGHARALLGAVLGHLGAARMVAETDGDAVGFYRRAGFEVENAPPRGNRPRFRVTLIQP